MIISHTKKFVCFDTPQVRRLGLVAQIIARAGADYQVVDIGAATKEKILRVISEREWGTYAFFAIVTDPWRDLVARFEEFSASGNPAASFAGFVDGLSSAGGYPSQAELVGLDSVKLHAVCRAEWLARDWDGVRALRDIGAPPVVDTRGDSWKFVLVPEAARSSFALAGKDAARFGYDYPGADGRDALAGMLSRFDVGAGDPDRDDLPSVPKRLHISDAELVNHYSHRSGWTYAVSLLSKLHSSSGVRLVSFAERAFTWAPLAERITEPLREPWVAFMHEVPHAPTFRRNSFVAMAESPIWKASLPHCKGIFCLSEYLAGWIRKTYPGVPVSVVYHPTGNPPVAFDMDKFRSNPSPAIVHIGWFLRNIASFYRLKAPGYRKVLLVKRDMRPYLQGEIWSMGPTRGQQQVELVTHLPDRAYDDLLARNIGFVNLYDASANNAVIECIARATPLLVNPHPAVMEYLGRRYPFYFTDVEEAARKAADLELVERAHRYLRDTAEVRERVQGDAFLKAVAASDVYKNL